MEWWWHHWPVFGAWIWFLLYLFFFFISRRRRERREKKIYIFIWFFNRRKKTTIINSENCCLYGAIMFLFHGTNMTFERFLYELIHSNYFTVDEDCMKKLWKDARSNLEKWESHIDVEQHISIVEFFTSQPGSPRNESWKAHRLMLSSWQWKNESLKEELKKTFY